MTMAEESLCNAARDPFFLKAMAENISSSGAKINGETALTGGHTQNLVQEILSERDKD